MVGKSFTICTICSYSMILKTSIISDKTTNIIICSSYISNNKTTFNILSITVVVSVNNASRIIISGNYVPKYTSSIRSLCFDSSNETT